MCLPSVLACTYDCLCITGFFLLAVQIAALYTTVHYCVQLAELLCCTFM